MRRNSGTIFGIFLPFSNFLLPKRVLLLLVVFFIWFSSNFNLFFAYFFDSFLQRKGCFCAVTTKFHCFPLKRNTKHSKHIRYLEKMWENAKSNSKTVFSNQHQKKNAIRWSANRRHWRKKLNHYLNDIKSEKKKLAHIFCFLTLNPSL